MAGVSPPLQLVIFDCDGVLVDSETLASELEVERFAELGMPMTAAEIGERFLGRSIAYVNAAIAEHLGGPLPAERERYWEGRYRALLTERLRPIPGVAKALEQITLPVCVASSSGLESIAFKLSLCGLADRFGDRIFSATQVRHGKPAPDLFLLAAERLQRRPVAVRGDRGQPGRRAGRAGGGDAYVRLRRRRDSSRAIGSTAKRRSCSTTCAGCRRCCWTWTPIIGGRDGDSDRARACRDCGSGPVEHRWSPRDVILYSLGIGARQPRDLEFLYERYGPRIEPTLALTAVTPMLPPLVERLGIDLRRLLHAGQRLTVLRQLAPAGVVSVTRTITGVWDKRAAALIECEDAIVDDEGILATAASQWWLTGAGGFGGSDPPSGSGSGSAWAPRRRRHPTAGPTSARASRPPPSRRPCIGSAAT